MMPWHAIDPAWWLLAGMVLLYLQDALLLLEADEWLLCYHGKARARQAGTETSATATASAATTAVWTAIWPTDRWRWLGRRMWLPALWRPDLPALRVRWHPDPQHAHGAIAPPADIQPLHQRLHAVRTLRWPIALLAMALLVLPLILLYAPWRDAWLAVDLCTIYGTVLWLLTRLWRNASAWGIPRATRTSLVLEYLLCPPLALNAIRRSGLLQTLPGDALAFAAQHLSAPQWHMLRHALQEQVHTELALLPDEDPRIALLENWWHIFERHYPAPASDADADTNEARVEG